ncbi:MAG: CrcB protein [Planctomycetota bacterium]|jgi:CrcB protein
MGLGLRGGKVLKSTVRVPEGGGLACISGAAIGPETDATLLSGPPVRHDGGMRELLLVGAGGFVGAILRYLTALWLAGTTFPFATLLVNVVGSFCIGALAGAMEKGSWVEAHRHFIAVGLLGALTTFSTFSLETVALLRGGQHGAAALSILLNVALALGAARAGLALTA